MALALRRALDRLALPLARAARSFVFHRGWTGHGFARLDDFGREALDRSGRWVRDLASLAASLERLPVLGRALTGDDGGVPLGTVAATWIGRVASRESAGAWIALARDRTVRDLRDAIRAARSHGCEWPPGLGPGDGTSLGPPGHPESEAESASGAEPVDRFSGSKAGEMQAAAVPDTPPAERFPLAMSTSSFVREAFDETLDLHRAATGSRATVGSFVEALTAETQASGLSLDEALEHAPRGPSRADVEAGWARRTGHWAGLPRRARGSVSFLCPELDEVYEALAGAGPDGPEESLRQLERLIDLEEDLQHRLGQVLLELDGRRAWAELGFADAGHYASERLRMSRSTAERRLRLARELRGRPRLRWAYEEGFVGSEAARLTAQALRGSPGRDVERAWVRDAMGVTVKRLRDHLGIVRRRSRPSLHAARSSSNGREPQPPADTVWKRSPSPSPGTPFPPDDATWHSSLRRAPGRTRARLRELGEWAFDDPSPDDTLRLRLTEDELRRFRGALAARGAALRETVELLHQVHGVEGVRVRDIPASAWLAGRFLGRGLPVPDWVALLSMLEDYAETWDDPEGFPRRAGDEVYVRDGWRCMAPGCTSRRNLEDHHVVYRSRGGGDQTSNRVCLCRFHHQQGEHGGLARVEGTAPLGLAWRLGRQDAARAYLNERRRDTPVAGAQNVQ